MKESIGQWRRSRLGFTLTETLIVGALFGLLAIISTFLLSAERARTRDAKRIADMTRLASGFAALYTKNASYADAAAGCPKVGLSAARCRLTDVVSGLDAIRDPGRFSYTVSRVPDQEDFGIRFRLERRYGTLAAGVHTLSKNGIR